MHIGRHIWAGILVLLLLFVVSIAVRLDYIDRPLSTNYEWVTAHTLVTLQIWHEEGILSHRFNPIYTFPNPNDHYIKCPISGISDDDGDYYYVSYPPFAFILPHTVFSVLGIDPEVLSLQVLNLVLHLLCCTLIYLTIIEITRRTSGTLHITPAVLGASIYMFSPLNLWHHANVYFADILVQLFFILDVFLLMRLFSPRSRGRNLILFALGVSLFLTMYTEWLGFLIAAVMGVYAILRYKTQPAAKPLLLVCIVSILAAGLLLLIQYGSISGFADFIETLQNRYTERSGQFGNRPIYRMDAHAYLLNLYLRNYFPVFVILVVLMAMTILFKVRPGKYPVKSLILITLIPVALHHLVLFEFTLVHDLALVKTSVFFSIMTGILFHALATSPQAHAMGYARFMPHFVHVSMLALCVFLYRSHVIEPAFSLEKLGTTIKAHAEPEETVFFKTTRTLGDFLIQAPGNFVIAPQIHYYSGRCIQVVPSIEDAQSFLKRYGRERGVVFTIENLDYEIEEEMHIHADSSYGISVTTDDAGR